MDRVTGDRGDVDDGALGPLERGREGARERERGEEVELVDEAPAGDVAVETPAPRPCPAAKARRLRPRVHGVTAAFLTATTRNGRATPSCSVIERYSPSTKR